MGLEKSIHLLDYNTLCRLEDDIDNQLSQFNISATDAVTLTNLKSSINNEIIERLQKNDAHCSKCAHLNQDSGICDLTNRDCKESIKDSTKLCQQARAEQFSLQSRVEKSDDKYSTLWTNLKDLTDNYVNDMLKHSQTELELETYDLSEQQLSEKVIDEFMNVLSLNGVPVEDVFPKPENNTKGVYIVTQMTQRGEQGLLRASTLKEAHDLMCMTAINCLFEVYDGIDFFEEFAEETSTPCCDNYDELKKHGLVRKFIAWIDKKDPDFEYSDYKIHIEHEYGFAEMNVHSLND